MDLLNEIQDFPIIFKFCVSESTHRDSNANYERFGYKNERDFYAGEILGDKETFVGWGDWSLSGSDARLPGMSGSNIISSNFIDKLFCKEILKLTNHNWSSIVKSIQISDRKILGTDINWPLVQHAYGCVPIDLR